MNAVPSRLRSLSLSNSFSMKGFRGVVSLVFDSCCSSAHMSRVSSFSSSTTLSSFSMAILERTLPSKDWGTLKICWRMSASVPWAGELLAKVSRLVIMDVLTCISLVN